VNSLPKTVTRQRRDGDLNPGPSAPESSTLTTRLPSHHWRRYRERKCADTIGTVLVPCMGCPFPMLRYKYIFQMKYTEAILSNTTQKLLWFEITKMLTEVKKITVSFILSFGTLSFPIAPAYKLRPIKRILLSFEK